jgi:hypothetical protein
MAGWIGQNLVGWSRKPSYRKYGQLSGHIAFADRTSRRLARKIASAMARYGPKLERRQAVLFRLVDIGAELYAMCASVVVATSMVREDPSDQSPVRLADLFCQRARQKVDDLFDDVFNDVDGHAYKVAQEVLDGDFTWLEEGILAPPAPAGIER